MVTNGGSRAGEDAFFADLRRLGELYRTRLARHLTLRPLARSAGVGSPTTIREWLHGSRFPQQADTFIAAVVELRDTAQRAGIEMSREEQLLLDPVSWRDRHHEVARLRAKAIGTGVQRERAVAALADHDAAARLGSLTDKPRPLANWHPQQLGVHPAIPGASEASPGTSGQSFVLPSYVEREHDQRLRARLDTVAAGKDAVLVVVRGESCTGKTRTAYEAVRTCLSDWQLVFPKDTDSLLSVLAADALAPRTVLWLNEAQGFLSGHSGEAAAVALRRQLERRGPVVIIATLWPEHHRTLTRLDDNGKDPHKQARALLAQADLFHVPNAFHGSALKSVHALDDSSLLVAVRTSRDAAITQTLAAGPQLVDHYEQGDGPPDCYGKAVITAAMDARRLGHTSPLSARFLEAAAPGYLTEAQRAAAPPDWFSRALAYARTKIMGVAAPLHDVASPSGMGAIPDVYRLADYLDHHARNVRRFIFPPALFWEAAKRYSASAADLHELAGSAESRSRLHMAYTLFREAAEGGHSASWAQLAYFCQDRGPLVDAENLAWKAWDVGYRDPLLNLVLLHKEADNHAEAERLARAAAETGHPTALLALAQLPEYLESSEESEQLALAAADLGDAEALTFCGRIRMLAGDSEAADRLFGRALAAGDVSAAFELMRMREKAGDIAGAERAARQAVDMGDYFVLAALASLLSEAPSPEVGKRLAREAVDLVGSKFTGMWDAPWTTYQGRWLGLSVLAGLAEKEGRGGWEEIYRQAMAEGDLQAIRQVADHRRSLGDGAEAERLYRRAADLGHSRALISLIRMQLDAGQTESAGELCRAAVDAGYSSAIGALADIWERRDGQERGEQLYTLGLELDGSMAAEWAPDPAVSSHLQPSGET
ncbi:hypothetical protein J7E96_01205 [Streptomyces sp. ISL-96]|uniref:tetratricopeptide repeat protein n=1 Tax=Streptomyces sp. ISL-96 TaxID=2819191 RepID=UPI001BE6FDAC|nr:hypothetical protein [Streptomyces sp. ISL-96]MBT2487178.1 hypothetical protein [Streptomyces sp. ISL-96]